ncbi:MAG: RES family NAD+ phosphorylase, partial [Hungatella sp.]
KGTIIYRGRKTDNILPEPLPFEQITSPSLEYIKGQNRFSCNKVSMFYGAKDEETAKKEIDYQNEPNLYIGRFSLLHKITILDLSQIKSPKGLFDKDWQGEYFILKFMNSFLKEIRKPVEDQTIDYKPTQSISDYIRNNEIYGHKVDGIKYKSSKNGKICYVFFWGAEDSAEHLKLKDYTHSRK